MQYQSEDILALLAAWKAAGHQATFVAHEGGAYLFDQQNGRTLQVVNRVVTLEN